MDLRVRLTARISIAALASFCLLVSSAPAVAQQPSEHAEPTDEASGETSADPSAEQLRLNEDAVKAIVEDDYSRAIALLEEARLLGDVNIVYLNLGRAYQKLGKCQKARAALQKAKEVPAVESPSPELVNQKVDDFIAELDAQCDDESALADETTAGGEPDAAGDHEAGVAPAPEKATSSAETWEWVVLGGGAAVAVGGVGVHYWAESKRADVIGDSAYQGDVNVTVTQQEAAALEAEANRLDNLALGMVIAGGVTAGVGTYLLLSGDESAESNVSLELSGEGGSVVWSGRF